MSYKISKSKSKLLDLLVNKKKQQENGEEYIIISDEKYAEYVNVDSSLICEYQYPELEFTNVMISNNQCMFKIQTSIAGTINLEVTSGLGSLSNNEIIIETNGGESELITYTNNSENSDTFIITASQEGISEELTNTVDPEPYTLIMTDEDFYSEGANIRENEDWFVVEAGPSMWNVNMGDTPKRLRNDIDGYFIRLGVTKTDDGYLTSGLKTYNAYGDGIFECEARFKGGHGTWPAIWMSHPHGSDNNYATYFEIDISEYYETRDVTETTYHYPKEMRQEATQVNVKTNIIKENNNSNISATGWNKFKCSWDENSIIVYINDVTVMTIENNGDSTYFPVNAEDRTFQIILSMQHAGNKWLSEPDDTELPLYPMNIEIKVIYFCLQS